MSIPQRIQIKRTSGWKMPAGAVKVDRSTIWGNPFREDQPSKAAIRAGARTAAEAYRLWLDGTIDEHAERRAVILARLPELKGKPLACWCKPGAECHADVLIEKAMLHKKPNPWIPASDPIELAHLSKLGEEANELGAAVQRCIMQGIDESEPVTCKPNRQWLEEEIADVLANIELVVDYYSLDKKKMVVRADVKKAHLRGWHKLLMERAYGGT